MVAVFWLHLGAVVPSSQVKTRHRQRSVSLLLSASGYHSNQRKRTQIRSRSAVTDIPDGRGKRVHTSSLAQGVSLIPCVCLARLQRRAEFFAI